MNDPLPPGVRPKLHGPTPFGWTEHDELPGMLIKVPVEQEALLKAFGYIDRGCTVTATARWLSTIIGRRVDQNSLRRFYRVHNAENRSRQSREECQTA
jgi:hypothetical protein